MGPSTLCGRAPPGRFARLVVALLIPRELREGVREGVLPAGPRLHHVIEVADARRVGGRLDRCEPRVTDRRRREAGPSAGVVGRVTGELALGERPGPVAGL